MVVVDGSGNNNNRRRGPLARRSTSNKITSHNVRSRKLLRCTRGDNDLLRVNMYFLSRAKSSRYTPTHSGVKHKLHIYGKRAYIQNREN